MKSQTITKVIHIIVMGDTNVCVKFCANWIKHVKGSKVLD